MHPLVDPEQSEVAEDPVADLALEVALLGGDVLVQVHAELVALAEVLAAHVADVHAELVLVLHVEHYRFRFADELVFAFARQAGVDVAVAGDNLPEGWIICIMYQICSENY